MSGQARYNTSSIYVGPTSLVGGATEGTTSLTYSQTLSKSVTTYVAPVSSGYTDTLATKATTAIPGTVWSQTTGHFGSQTTSAPAILHWPPDTSLPSDLTSTYHVTSSFSAATSLLTETTSAPGLQSLGWSLWSSTSSIGKVTVLSTSLLPNTIHDEHQHSGVTDTPSPTRDLQSTGWSLWSGVSLAGTVTVLSTSLLPNTIYDEHQHSGVTDTPSPTRDLQSTGWSLWSGVSSAGTVTVLSLLPDTIDDEHQSTRDLQSGGWPLQRSTSPVITSIDTVSYPSAIRSTSVMAIVTSQHVDPEVEHKSPFSTTHIETSSSATEAEGDLDVTSGVSRRTTDIPDMTLSSSATRVDGFPGLHADIVTAAVAPSSLVSQTAAPSTRSLISISSTSLDLNSGGKSQSSSNSQTVTIYSSRSYVTMTSGTDSLESQPTISTTRSFATAATDSEPLGAQSALTLQSGTNSAHPTSGGGQIQSIDDTATSSAVLRRSAEISAGAVGASLCIIIGIFVWIRRVRRRGTIYVGMQQRPPDISRFSFDT